MVPDLERRIADLEEKLGGKWPADVCKKCGERAMRENNVIGPDAKGNMRHTWACSECGHHEDRLVKPK